MKQQYKRACILLIKNKNKPQQLADRLLKRLFLRMTSAAVSGERPYEVKPDKKENGRDVTKVAVN